MNLNKELLTTNELSAYFKVTRQAVDRWRKSGMPHITLGPKSIRYDLEEVEKYFANKRDIKKIAKNKSPEELESGVDLFYRCKNILKDNGLGDLDIDFWKYLLSICDKIIDLELKSYELIIKHTEELPTSYLVKLLECSYDKNKLIKNMDDVESFMVMLEVSING